MIHKVDDRQYPPRCTEEMMTFAATASSTFGHSGYYSVGPILKGLSAVNYQYYLVRFVDAVNGNDTNDGSILHPFQTIGAALASITDASNTKRYLIDVAAGLYNEGGNPVVWKPFISLFGKGFDVTLIPNGINYTAPAGEAGRIDWVGCRCDGVCTIDCSAAINTNFRLINFRCAMTWNGGPDYPNTQANNLLCHSVVFTDLVIIDGAAHLYDNMGIFSSLTIGDGPAVNSLPFLEIEGGLIQGTISLTGKAAVYARGVFNTTNMTGAIASGVTPLYETDSGSMPTGTISGPIRFIFDDFDVAKPTTAFTVTKESYVFADATSGSFVVTIPVAADYVGKPITVQKIDNSVNTVTVNPADSSTIFGSPNALLSARYQQIICVSDGTVWRSLT